MRYVRSFLLVLTTLAFFLLVLVAGLYAFITPERISNRVIETLSHHLGLQVEIGGLHIDTRLPNLKFSITDTVLTSTDGTVQGCVPSTTIALHPLALFTRSPRISEITTSDASITLGNTSPEDVRNWIKNTIQPLAFNIDKFIVHRGAVYLSQAMPGAKPWAYLNNTSAVFRNLSEAGAAYSITGVLKLPEILGNAELKGCTDLSNGLLSASTQQLDANFRGEVRGRHTELSGHADAIQLSRENATITNLSVIQKRINDNVFKLSAPSLTLDTHTLNASSLTTFLTLTSPENPPIVTTFSSFKIDFDTQRLEAPAVSISVREKHGSHASVEPSNLTGSLIWNATSGNGRAEFGGTLQGTAVTLDLAISNAMLCTADQAPLPKTFPTIPHVSGRIVLGEIPLKTAVNLISHEKLLKDIEAAVEFSVLLNSPYIGSHEATGRLVTGAGKAHVIDGVLNLASAPVPFDAEFSEEGLWLLSSSWNNIDGQDLFPSLLTGSLSGTLNASGLLQDTSKTIASITLEARQGEFFGADLELASQIMRNIQPEEPPTSAFLRDSCTAFTSLSCALSLNDGAWNIRNGTAEGMNWKAVFTGAYEQLNCIVDFATDNGEDFFTMPVRIQTNPVHWMPDWQTAYVSAQGHMGKLPWTTENFKDRILQQLENWWNKFDTSKLKFFDFGTKDFSLPDIKLPDIELPDRANRFLEKEKAPENSSARNSA